MKNLGVWSCLLSKLIYLLAAVGTTKPPGCAYCKMSQFVGPRMQQRMQLTEVKCRNVTHADAEYVSVY